jgi:hypothetical protein
MIGMTACSSSVTLFIHNKEGVFCMPYPTRGTLISKTDADTLVNAFQGSAAYFNGVKGGFYGSEMIQTLLNQKGCDGLRYYHGLGPDPNDGGKIKQTIVLVAEDANGNLLTGAILEVGPLCPPYCPNGAGLGS